VHDYHLQLVPKILKRYRPDIRIGFFLHTPFPNFGSLQKLPHWQELVEGISDSHLVGFQTLSDQHNFRVALYNSRKSHLGSRGATPKTIVNPVSVDYARWNEIANQPENLILARKIRNYIGSEKTLIVGIDRLEQTKGILNRLIALHELLCEEQIDAGKIAMIVFAGASRISNSSKDSYKLRIENLILRINNEFGKNGSPVVYYTNRNMTPIQVSAFFSASDILIVSSLHDGMNLISKEFVANSKNDRGILILSKNAGSANDLDAALKIDPYDIPSIKNSILTAVNMTQSDAIARMKSLRNSVRSHNVYDWANQFMANLDA
jgi:trehalose-6-phosphate synthase